MNKLINAIVDSNIFLNVWNNEINPATQKPLWEASSRIMILAKKKEIRAHICFITALELVHFVRVRALAVGTEPEKEMERVLQKINDFGFTQILPAPHILQNSISLVLRMHLDPFDAIMLATAVGEDMDVIISRDKKLAAKATPLIPVLTPEAFLDQFSSSNPLI